MTERLREDYASELKEVYLLEEATNFNGGYGETPNFHNVGVAVEYKDAFKWAKTVSDGFTLRRFTVLKVLKERTLVA